MEGYIHHQHKDMSAMKDMFNYLMHKLGKRPSPGDPPSEFPKNTGSKFAIEAVSSEPLALS